MAAFIAGIYGGFEQWAIVRIAQRLLIDAPSDKAEFATWQRKKFVELAAWNNEANQQLRTTIQSLPKAVHDLTYQAAAEAVKAGNLSVLKDAYKRGLIRSNEVLPDARRIHLLTLMNEQAANKLNIVNTTMISEAQQKYLDIINQAAASMTDVSVTPRQVIQDATQRLADTGFTGFIDKAGRKWSTESAVEMMMRTHANGVSTQATYAAMESLGTDLLLTSSHLGARPKCFEDQGQIFSRSGAVTETTDKNGKKWPVRAWSESSHGKPDGMLGINCRHSIVWWIDGQSENLQVQYDYSENDKRYKAEQKQRGLERGVRNGKTKLAIAEAAGDEDAARAARDEIKRNQAALREHTKANGLPRHRVREQVVKSQESAPTPAVERSNFLDEAMKQYDVAVANEPAITAAIQDAANALGMKIEGIENRIKGVESYQRKMLGEFNAGRADYIAKDVLRYTFVDSADTLVDHVRKSIVVLQKKGYNTIEVKNSWNNPKQSYKGINTVLKSPSGQLIEVQYHTPESFEMKMKTHGIFEKQRLLGRDDPEYDMLEKEQWMYSDALKWPKGIEGLK